MANFLEDLVYNAFYGDQEKKKRQLEAAAQAQVQARQQLQSGQINKQQYGQQVRGAAQTVQSPMTLNPASVGVRQRPKSLLEQAGDAVGGFFLGNTAKLANTANYGLVQPVVGLAQGKSSRQVQRDIDSNLYSDKGGLLNQGTFFPTKEKYNQTFKDPVSFAKGFTGAGLSTATEVVPAARGASLLTKPGLSAGQKVIRGAIEGGLYGAGGTAGQQLLEKGRLDAKGIAFGAGLGAATGGAIPAAGMAVKGGINASRTAAKTAQNVNRRVEQANPDVKRLDSLVMQYQRAFDKESNPARRRQISQGIAELNTQRRNITQGGFARIPSAKGQSGQPDPLQLPLDQKIVGPSSTPRPLAPNAKKVASRENIPAQEKPLGKQSPQQQIVPESSTGSIPSGNRPGFITSARQSKELSPELKGELNTKARYTPESNEAQVAASLDRLNKEGADNVAVSIKERLNAKSRNVDAQTVSDAIAAGKALDAKGDTSSLQKATELYEQLAEKLTKAGQTVQAASLLNSRTPQGLYYGAVRDLKKSGVEVSPTIQKELNDLITAVKQTDPNTYDGQLARYNVAKYVGSKTPTKLTDKAVNFWRAGLLTSPTTTGGNILGNVTEAATRGVSRPVSNAADALMSLVTGKRTIASPSVGSFTSGATQGAKKIPAYIKTGFDERNALTKYDAREINYGDGDVGKNITRYVNGVYRTMSLADQPFWYGARNSSLASLAKADAINKGLKGQARAQYIQDFTKNPPAKAMERATEDAMYATFQNKTGLGDAAIGFKKGLNKVMPGLGDFIVPFTQVPASIATRIFQRTPVGTATEMVKQIINVRRGGQFDQKRMAEAIGDGAFGTAVLASGFSLANSGMMTFGYPEDQKERELWEAEGKQPYSIKVGDRWYSLNYMQPLGTILAIGGQAGENVKDGMNASEAVSNAVATAGQAMMNQSFLKGVSGVLDAIDDPKRYAENFVENTAGSLLPNIVRAGARSIDPYQRDPKGALEGIQAGIPGVRQSLPTKLDMFGKPLEAKDNALNQFLNPLRPSIARDSNSVTQELRRLYEGDEGILPTQAKKDAFKDVMLTDKQVREINELAGPALQQEYAKVISSPDYQNLSDEDKRKALKKVNDTVYGALKFGYGVETGLVTPTEKNKPSTDQKRYLKGSTVDFLSKSDDKKTYQERYDEAQSKYEEEKDTLSPVERQKREKDIYKLQVQKDYDSDTVSLYGMNKADVYNLVSKDPNGNKYVENILKYGDALVAAGIEKTNRFRDKYGNLKLEDPATSSSKGKKGKKLSPSDFKLPTDILVKYRTKGAELARNAKLVKNS